MGKTLKPLIIGIIIGAIGLYAYQNPNFRSQASEFVGGILNSVSDAPTPPAVAALPAPTATPIKVAPVQVTPAPTASPALPPTIIPENPSPTGTPTSVPAPTPTPAPYSIKVMSVERVERGQVDFLLEVRNGPDWASDKVAQVGMSVDGGASEVVNIIGILSPGESRSFAFTRTLAPGHHAVRFSVGDSHTDVSVNVEAEDVTVSTPTPQPTLTATMIPTLIPTNTPFPNVTPLPTHTPLRTVTPTPTPTLETAVFPDLRHSEEKTYMLELINAEREKAGLDSVVLGDNIAAQLHAEAALENCFASHWGVDGLKPYMRYSLAGGYQSNGENGSGSDYCIKGLDGYRAIANIKTEIRQAMEGWMDSPGHRSNILGRWHKKINIGLAWDKYNFLAYQHFEGDYVEYNELPVIEDGVLRISGRTKNGARFNEDRDLGIQIFYDQPPHLLTRGQVTRTYCYDSGLQIAALREPLTGGWFWDEDEFTMSYKPCPNPYDVPVDAPGPTLTRRGAQVLAIRLRCKSTDSRNSYNRAVGYGIGMDDQRRVILREDGLERSVVRIWGWRLIRSWYGGISAENAWLSPNTRSSTDR